MKAKNLKKKDLKEKGCLEIAVYDLNTKESYAII